ncbi:MAG: hypothetical protein ABWZ79_05965 [Pedobacter agri]
MDPVEDLAKEVCSAIQKSFEQLTETVKIQDNTIKTLIREVEALKMQNNELIERFNILQKDFYEEVQINNE